MRLWKRKLPSREEKPYREVSKIAGKVFDDKTVEVLVHLMNTNVISSLDYPIAAGKESVVFRATRADKKTGGKEFRAVKVFKYETSAFRKMLPYIEGDPRFLKVQHKRRPLVAMWARKEYANLRLCEQAKVPAPKPLALKENVVVMEFLGEGGVPCSLLKDIVLENPEEALDVIVEGMRRMYSFNLVHADVSPFNIITCDEKPFFIDFGQGVLKEHPKAEEFLQRDVETILKYFERTYGIKRDAEKTLEQVKSGSKHKERRATNPTGQPAEQLA
jgi:RIO kinase 1